MRTIFSRIGRFLSWIGNFQVLAGLLPQSVLAVLSGYLVYGQSGFGWAIFIASGVFCFLSISIVVVRTAYRTDRLDHKLNITGVNLVQHATGTPNHLIYRPAFMLHNMAPYELFFELKSYTYHFDGLTRLQADETLAVSGLLAPQDTGNIVLAGSSGAPGAPKGRMVVEVHYGRSKEKLTHSFKTTLYCTSTTFLGDMSGAHVMLRNVEKIEYAALKSA